MPKAKKKRKFSQKQLAAQRLFAKRAKAGDFFKRKSKRSSRSTPKTKTKVKSRSRATKPMARKSKRATIKSIGKSFKLPFVSSPIIKKAAAGAGIAALAGLAAGFIPGLAPIINQPIAKAILGLSVGGIPGAIASFATSGGINAILGGGGQQSTANVSSFA